MPEKLWPSKFATGKITYVEGGMRHTWSIGCMAHETQDDLKKHLEKWRPGAIFVDAVIIPDNEETLHSNNSAELTRSEDSQ